MTKAQTTSDPDTSGALVSPQRRNFVFLAIVLGMLMAALDQTIVATALPTIVADLGEAGHQSWVVTSYLLASTIITALVGRLGDLFGRKLIFPGGGDVLCHRLGAVRAFAVNGHGGGCPGAAGHRRRRHHGHGHRADRRSHPVAGSRPPDAGRTRATDHRLHPDPVRWPGCDRPDTCHQLGRDDLSVELGDDHRAVRRLYGGAGHLRLDRKPRRRADSADPALR